MGQVFDTVAGLPVHALVVHVAVVLAPLTAIGAIAMVVRPSFSRRFGPMIVATGALAALAVVAARLSGPALALRVGLPVDHERYGTWLPVVFGLLFVLLLGFWIVDRGIPLNRPRPGWVRILAILVVVLAFATLALTLVVGHSGAVAVWAVS